MAELGGGQKDPDQGLSRASFLLRQDAAPEILQGLHHLNCNWFEFFPLFKIFTMSLKLSKFLPTM